MKKLILALIILSVNLSYGQQKEGISAIDKIIKRHTVKKAIVEKRNRNENAIKKIRTLLTDCKEDEPFNCLKNLHLDSIKPKPITFKLLNDSIISYGKVDTLFNTIKSTFLENYKLKGAFSFGISNNNTNNDDQDQLQFSIQAKVNKGIFPGEFKFNSALDVQFVNDKLIENLSDLSLSYDHFLDNDLKVESYIFIKRSSNNFLNVDQRYEFGAGFTYNAYSGSSLKTTDIVNDNYGGHLNKKGEEAYKKFGFKHFLRNNNQSTERRVIDEFLAICSDESCQLLNTNKSISDKQKKENEDFENTLRETLNSIKTYGSKWRFSVLAGINYELEAMKNSTPLRYQDSIVIDTLVPRNLIRGVVAPSLTYSKDVLTMRSRCFFKVAISKDDIDDIVTQNDDNFINPIESSRLDYRIEWENSLSVDVSEKIKIVGILNYQWINAPRRKFTNLSDIQTEPDYKLFKSNNHFLGFNVKCEIKL